MIFVHWLNSMDNVNNIKSLTATTKTVFCCINYPKRSDNTFDLSFYNLDDLAEGLTINMFRFAFRVHDKDTDDDGVFKTPHIHLYIDAMKRHQLKYYIYLLADLLNVPEYLISVKPADSEAGCIQYLTHKIAPQKYQYSLDGVHHNYNKELFDELYNADVRPSLSVEELIDLCRTHSKLELIKILGLSRYNLYSKTINEIYKEVRLENLRVKRNNNITNIHNIS